MKNHFRILLLILITFGGVISIAQCAFAQNPLVKQWDYRYGGNDLENLTSFKQTRDGGYLLAGYSYSTTSGDKTQPLQGFYDFWIVKLDAMGIKEWDKDFGGTNWDQLFSAQQTTDGGYILAGSSWSGSGGDKTQGVVGTDDYWIVKTDSVGTKLWDRDFGGTSNDELYSIQQTEDGGFILGGYSSSPAGGDKTQNTLGGADYWIIKTDSLGIKQWDKDFGGTGSEQLTFIQQTNDKGYILGGYSSSGISGDKTQSTFGLQDYWIVKTDSLGIKQWDQSFGGTLSDYLYSLTQTIDHGYILGGVSWSGISGNKTTPLWGGNITDYWIIKTDSFGNKTWEKDFGGTSDDDVLGNITQTSDSGYLIAGTSYSNISGNKTENNPSLEQSWGLKTNSLGDIEWDKTLFSAGHDESGFAIQTSDGCYAFANCDMGGIGGYKTQTSQGGDDYWIVKFCDSTLVYTPVALFNAPNHICPGTCTSFLNLSTHSTSYLWNFAGATPSTSTDENPTSICYNTPGSYAVSLIATGAGGSDTLQLNNFITVYPYPSPQGITQSGDTLIANQGAVSYQWYLNGSLISGATDYFYVAQASGDYYVVATDGNGCEVEAAIFNVIAGVQSTVDRGAWTIFPNPVTENLSVISYQLSGAATLISLYNVLGETVSTFQPKTSTVVTSGINLRATIDVSQLPAGMYYLELIYGSKSYRTKFVKQ